MTVWEVPRFSIDADSRTDHWIRAEAKIVGEMWQGVKFRFDGGDAPVSKTHTHVPPAHPHNRRLSCA